MFKSQFSCNPSTAFGTVDYYHILKRFIHLVYHQFKGYSCLSPFVSSYSQAHILLCSHLFTCFLILTQITVDSKMVEVRLPILCSQKSYTEKTSQSTLCMVPQSADSTNQGLCSTAAFIEKQICI